MKELQLAIDALVTPESQAFADYINGCSDNQYERGSLEFRRYDNEYKKLEAAEEEGL